MVFFEIKKGAFGSISNFVSKYPDPNVLFSVFVLAVVHIQPEK